jgi:hypothetical protein
VSVADGVSVDGVGCYFPNCFLHPLRPEYDVHSNLFSRRCFAPVSAQPNFVACFGREFVNIEVRWLITALNG